MVGIGSANSAQLYEIEQHRSPDLSRIFVRDESDFEKLKLKENLLWTI